MPRVSESFGDADYPVAVQQVLRVLGPLPRGRVQGRLSWSAANISWRAFVVPPRLWPQSLPCFLAGGGYFSRSFVKASDLNNGPRSSSAYA